MLPLSPARLAGGAQGGESATGDGEGKKGDKGGGRNDAGATAGRLAGSSKFLRIMRRLTARQFLQVCVLSGCDYINSLPGVGTVSAAELVWRYRDTADDRRVLRVVAAVRQKAAGGLGKKRRRSGNAKKAVEVPVDYEMRFRMAESCFLHHVVYDPKAQVAAFLTPVPSQRQAILLTPMRPLMMRGVSQQGSGHMGALAAGQDNRQVTAHSTDAAAAGVVGVGPLASETKSIVPASAAASAGVGARGAGEGGAGLLGISPVQGQSAGDGSSYLSTP